MPFGLCNRPATFQRWINQTLQRFIDRSCIVYLDDVLIYSDNLEQHKRDVRNIINAIYQSGMRLKPSKCEFNQTETEYLGFIVSQEGIKVDPIKTEAIRIWKTATKKKEIQSFLGFCNFYRRFIEGFSKIAKPLYQLTKKDQKWEFGMKQQEAFNGLIYKLPHAPILAQYDPKKPITIETDASKYVMAGIISQTGADGILRPIAYRSKSMSKSKCNYDVHDKELLAIILALEDWRRYIKGSRQQTKILMDHKNLVPFMTKKRLNERQVRWKQFLSQFDFKIVYQPGKEGGKPDPLTRGLGYLPAEDDERNTQMEQILLPEHYFENLKIEAMELTILHDEDSDMIRNTYRKDQKIMNIKDALDIKIKEMKGVALRLCEWKDGHLWYQGKIWVPEDEGLQTTIISRCHDNPLAGQGEQPRLPN